MTSTRHAQLPPRLLPVLYFAAAHLAFAAACAAVAADPEAVSGFFYHARMVAIVHLVTLGWITTSIVGSLYLVGPIALRVRFAATWLDYAAFGLVTAGITAMVVYFWQGKYGAVGWCGTVVGLAVMIVGAKVVPRLITANIPRAVIAHIALAFINIAAAATLGVLIAFDKVYHFFPGYVLTNVFAHAHLAAIGWASMMVVGVAYRLLPMVLPAQMPSGWRLWMTAILLEGGVLGLATSLLLRAGSTSVFALGVVAGFATFLAQVAWMFRHPRPRPPGIRTPDPAVLHAVAAFASLAASSALGMWLVLSQPSAGSLRVAMAYGVFGLIGFLSQLVVGMEGRLLPLFAWYWAFANTNFKGPVASPHEMPWRNGQGVIFVLWMFGVPCLAGGLALDAVPFVRAGAWSLLIATVLDSINAARIVRHAFVPAMRVES